MDPLKRHVMLENSRLSIKNHKKMLHMEWIDRHTSEVNAANDEIKRFKKSLHDKRVLRRFNPYRNMGGEIVVEKPKVHNFNEASLMSMVLAMDNYGKSNPMLPWLSENRSNDSDSSDEGEDDVLVGWTNVC